MVADTILSIDCANRWTCLGLWRDGPVGETALNLGRNQAARLPLVAEGLLTSFGLGWSDVTALAVTVGPGYFTALRIGLAYGCGLALALGIPVVPLSSLEVLARSARRSGLIVPLIAASRRLVFSAAWRNETRLLDEAERSREELDAALALFGDKERYLVAVADERLFSESGRDGVTFIPCASGLAAVELGYISIGEAGPPEGIRARYLREPGLGRSE